ncbi:replicase [Halyomorpha halys erranti-like virus 1]|nr:replicase [Halyomorpha halys erranti-like virus 1]
MLRPISGHKPDIIFNNKFPAVCYLCCGEHYIWHCAHFNNFSLSVPRHSNGQYRQSQYRRKYPSIISFSGNSVCESESPANNIRSVNTRDENYTRKFRIDKRRRNKRNSTSRQRIPSPVRAVSRPFLPKILVDVGPLSVETLVDSGSVRSIMSAQTYERLKGKTCLSSIRSDINCVTASNEALVIDFEVSCSLKIDCFTWKFPFLVAPNLSSSMILGADFMKHTNLILDFHRNCISFKFRSDHCIPLYGSSPTNNINLSPANESIERPDPLSHLSNSKRNDIDKLIASFPHVLNTQLGLTDLLTYDIKLRDTVPVKSVPYQLALPKTNYMRGHINELLDLSVITPSRSPYASPAFLVTRPDRKPRLVIDYRKLNQKIEIEAVPLPNIHHSFQWFSKAKYFSVLDLSSAYHQIPLSPKSRPLTAFCTPWMLYEYTRLPFGISTGAQTLTRLLDLVFHDIKFKFVFNYLDDIIVYSESWTEHLFHLREVLSRLGRAKLTVNPEKVTLGASQISFLGHLVSSRGVLIDPSRTSSVRDFPPPKDAKGVARFVGMVNFFSKFIPKFSQIAAPLNQLRKKGCKFFWGEEQQKAFEALKLAIISPPVLRMPDFDREFILQTDASSCALGAVLLQDVDGIRQPIAYASRSLTPGEKKASSAYELECLAVVFGIEKFRQYLEHREFLLETDNQALSWLLAHPRQLGKIGRWVAKLTSFKFRVQHIRGTQNVIADTLSRMYDVHSAAIRTVPSSCNALLSDFPLSFAELKEYQSRDPTISSILQSILSGKPDPKFCLSKGLLCKADKSGQATKIILPASLVDMVFKYYHVCPVGGHLGVQKTIGKILEFFYWTAMYDDIRQRVRSCDVCATSKPNQNTKVGYLSSELPSRPLQKIFIDYVGPLIRSKTGNLYILVVVDAFSRFTWLRAVRNANADVTIKVLYSIFYEFGFPKHLVSDNATYFVSKAFKNFCFSNGIKHSTTSPYYPQPSYAERFNRNLKSCLIAYHSDSQNTWDQSLGWLQFAFNSATHDATDRPPFDVIFRYQPYSPLALQWSLDELLPCKVEQTADVWKKVESNLKRAHAKVEKQYNKFRHPNPFVVGDFVWCKTHPQSSAIKKRSAKLMPRWDGPFLLHDFLTPVTAQLADPKTLEVVKKAHISHLKPSAYTNYYEDPT